MAYISKYVDQKKNLNKSVNCVLKLHNANNQIWTVIFLSGSLNCIDRNDLNIIRRTESNLEESMKIQSIINSY